MRSRKFIIMGAAILLAATLAFIWCNSLQSIPDSEARSLGALAKVRPLLEIVVGKGRVTDHLVRKLAHFMEYDALGCELALLLVFLRKIKLQPIINCLFVGMAAVLTDETIQVFTGRGSLVQDVWLDFFGTAAGILVSLLFFRLIKVLSRKKDIP